MTSFDYSAFAELYPSRNFRHKRVLRYRRFATAAEALRYAMEQMPRELLAGSTLEVDEERFEAAEIDALYRARDYPLARPMGIT
ncbi:hypothetical protein VE25_18010 [Devosia geojensis]|uniref:Uncharacterized protein n=1 Tax=Devosia geojensis TaxID=443610 RepID=A0A0F5FNN5_9HYPH|nr:hypothetical protein [Devosia geojensis]KKB10443.1 hypothetical protein VE25_18010 [Devosia geojensis]